VIKKILPTEHAEQIAFIQWWDLHHPDIRIFAIPNGGFRHKQTAQKLKLEGVRKGVPDLFVPSLQLFIEMKRQKGGVVSPEQKRWIEHLLDSGYYCIVAKGAADAIEQVKKYIK